MPITVQWYQPHNKNIHYHLQGEWTWEDLSNAIEIAMQLLDSVDYPVNLIIDFTDSNKLPTFVISELRKVANAPTMSHPNTAELYIVGANSYIEIMARVFSRLFPQAGARYGTFKTRDSLNAHLQDNL